MALRRYAALAGSEGPSQYRAGGSAPAAPWPALAATALAGPEQSLAVAPPAQPWAAVPQAA
eukprot:9225726-Lingulodinium_polyedra.AAC.1